jgi:hypothetical protein
MTTESERSLRLFNAGIKPLMYERWMDVAMDMQIRMSSPSSYEKWVLAHWRAYDELCARIEDAIRQHFVKDSP